MLIVFLFTEFSTLVAIRLVLLYDRSSSDARAINFNFDIHSLQLQIKWSSCLAFESLSGNWFYAWVTLCIVCTFLSNSNDFIILYNIEIITRYATMANCNPPISWSQLAASVLFPINSSALSPNSKCKIRAYSYHWIHMYSMFTCTLFILRTLSTHIGIEISSFIG